MTSRAHNSNSFSDAKIKINSKAEVADKPEVKGSRIKIHD
jgi:hypothetical protein